MAAVWTIKGEAGKTVDATARTLPELQAQDAIVDFGADRMTWTIWLGDPATETTIIPDLGQKITLYLNGARYFTGNVLGRDPVVEGGRSSMNISVEGLMWWLKSTPLSAELVDQRGEGSESERTAFVFPTGSVTDHLQGLITRGQALGIPFQPGSLATCFDIPRLSLRNISFAESFSELMRWIADGILYIDYSGDDEDPPALCMQRRPTATTLTIDPANGIFPVIKLKPRLELKVSAVEITYAERATVDNKRITQWARSAAGTPTSGRPDRQVIVVSGPELDTYLPQDFTDAVVVRSAEIEGNHAALVEQMDGRIRAAEGDASDFTIGNFSDDAFTMPSVGIKITDKDGNALPEGYDYYLLTGEPKDWWPRQSTPIEYIEARLTATLYSTHTVTLPLPESPYTPPLPGWYEVIGGQVAAYSLSAPGRARWVWYTTVSVPFVAVKTLWETDTTLIRDEDYSFVHPPADLAANLLSTQNWLPYEGTVVQDIDPGNVPAGHYIGAKMNVLGLTEAEATMGAMISGQSVSLRTGRITYTVGAPARLAYRDLVNRFRQSGADNVIWLNETSPVSGEASGPSSFRTLTESGLVELTEDGQATRDEG